MAACSIVDANAYIKNCAKNNIIAKLTAGNQIRDYLEVRDAAKIIVKVAMGKFSGQINVCSGIPITVKQFAEKIAKDLGCKQLLKFGARSQNAVDPDYIVGITRGGNIPATIISNMLDIPCEAIKVSFRNLLKSIKSCWR